MRDGLKIYACSGFGVGDTPAMFNYWLDNTETVSNTAAVNSLLADINFIAAKLQYGELDHNDTLQCLNMIDLYTVCLYGAEQYSGNDLIRYGRIVGEMAENGAFYNESTDNELRDANLDELVSLANTMFVDGEDPQVENDTTRWFFDYIVARDFVGLDEERRNAVRDVLNSGAVSGTEADAASVLGDFGGYYLYLYMTPTQARKLGKVVYAKRKKQQEMYEYVQAAYSDMYGGRDAVDKIIYTGICKQYGHTPEKMVDEMIGKRESKGVGELVAIVTAISTIVSIIITILTTVLQLCGASLQAKYQQPADPDFGTPGFGGEDLTEITEFKGTDKKGLFGTLAAVALILYGLFK